MSKARDIIELLEMSDYRGTHEAPTNDGYHSPLTDVTKFYPDDIYTMPLNKAIYVYGDPYRSKDNDSYAILVIRKYRNKPKRKVMIYRAVPKGIKGKFNPGDWVTTVEAYAREHGERQFDDNYQIISKSVKASEIFTDGNDVKEWGYDPS
jgi:hypothetical protein